MKGEISPRSILTTTPPHLRNFSRNVLLGHRKQQVLRFIWKLLAFFASFEFFFFYKNRAKITQYVMLSTANSSGKNTLEKRSMFMARVRFLCAMAVVAAAAAAVACGGGLGGGGSECPSIDLKLFWKQTENSRILSIIWSTDSCRPVFFMKLGAWGNTNNNVAFHSWIMEHLAAAPLSKTTIFILWSRYLHNYIQDWAFTRLKVKIYAVINLYIQLIFFSFDWLLKLT